MHIHVLRTVCALLLTCVVGLVACAENDTEYGVVARVNGDPIHHHDLQYDHELTQSVSGVPTSSVEVLREEYGRILSTLIVQRLVMQDLTERGLAVTDDELRQAEEAVRADYPDDEAFRDVLEEEFVDLAKWRDQLRARLSMEKFNDFVLRPRVSITSEEAEAYYRENLAEYYLPERFDFYIVRAPSKELLDRALELLRGGSAPEDIEVGLRQVMVRRTRMREDRLPAEWREALAGLSRGQASQVVVDREGFSRFYLVQLLPARVLSPTQAYHMVEKVLIEEKLRREFEAWLQHELAGATIEVNTSILHASEDESVNGEAATPPVNPQPVPGAGPASPALESSGGQGTSDGQEYSGADGETSDASGTDSGTGTGTESGGS